MLVSGGASCYRRPNLKVTPIDEGLQHFNREAGNVCVVQQRVIGVCCESDCVNEE